MDSLVMTAVHSLYWHHLEEFQDPLSQGYIGVSCQLNVRTLTHKSYNSAYSPKLREAYLEYGDLIKVKVLHEGSKEDMLSLEREYRPDMHIGWNFQRGGGFTPDCTGNTHTEETKRKISMGNKGKGLGKVSPFKGITNRYDPDVRKLIGSYHKGKTISEKHKQAIKEKNSGEFNSKSQRVVISHVDDSDKKYTFVNYREAAEKLGITYSSLREQGRKRLGKANRNGWVVEQVGER